MKINKKILKPINPQIVAVIKLIHFYHRWAIPSELVKSALTAIKPFINIICSSVILDRLIARSSPERIMQTVYWMVGLNLITAFLIGVLDWLRKSYLNLYYISDQCFSEKALQLDYERMEQTEIRDMIRLHDQVVNFGGAENFLQILGTVVQNLVSLVYAVVLMVPFFFSETLTGQGAVTFFFTSPLSSLVLAAGIAISLWASLQNFKKQEDMVKESWKEEMQFNRQFQYFHNSISKYQNGKDIRSYSLAELYLDRFRTCIRHSTEFMKKQVKADRIYGGRIVLISQSAIVLFYLAVGAKALLGVISVGSILKYVSALTGFHEAFLAVMSNLTEMNVMAEQLKCDTDFFSISNKKYEGQIPVEKRNDNEYEIEFRNVSFSYPGSRKKVLDHVSFRFRIGEKLALVGKNGAGKTTFIKLLCRLYDPTDGEILLNGIDIKKYDYQEYQSLFSVVFQDFKLFSFELGQNVAANTDYEEEEVYRCLEKAGIGQRVRQMKQGLKTVLYQTGDNGVEISGGEAQKIAIARALYKDAPIIIMDEPTSALDPISEYEIYSKFDRLVCDKTAIYISHRMSSCRFCDRIIVFDEGNIRENGTHEQLLAQNGLYSQMWKAQAKYYEETAAETEK